MVSGFLVRRPILLGAAAVVALAAGLYALRPRNDPQSAANTVAVGPRGEASGASLVDAAAPLPQTTANLIEEAAGLAQWLTQEMPGDPDALEIVARIELSFGDSARALAHWEECLRLDPAYAHAYHGMGLVAASKGDDDEALALFRKALDLAPGAIEPQTELAATLVKLGKTREAVPLLERSVQASYGVQPASRYGRASQLLGKAYLTLKEYGRAKAHFQKFLRDFPDDASSHFGLATALARLGEAEPAAAHMERFKQVRSAEAADRRARREEPYDEHQTREVLAGHYTTAGRVCDGGGRPREAVRLWARAALLDPKDGECRELLLAAYRRDRRPADAAKVLDELVALAPGAPAYWIELGQVRAALGQTDAAEQALKRACEIAPLDARSYAALADLYLQGNRKPHEALGLARTAVQLAPGAAHERLLAEARRRCGEAEAAQPPATGKR